MSVGSRRSRFVFGVGMWLLTAGVGNASAEAEEGRTAPRLLVEGRTLDEVVRLAPGQSFVVGRSLVRPRERSNAVRLQPEPDGDEAAPRGGRRHVLIGGVIGAGIGAVWGGNSCRNEAAAVTCRYTWAAAAVGLGIGAGVGAIVGAFGGN